jgi:hypothetical protein
MHGSLLHARQTLQRFSTAIPKRARRLNAFLDAMLSETTTMELLTLYRPVGPKELALIEASGWREFPPRLPDQPIFYPVTNEEYATQIARDWNLRHNGAGFVTRFQIRAEFAARYPAQAVGAAIHTELWVPAEELTQFNENIIGLIEVIAEFR